ncbi:MAG: hypothetical protein FRX49_02272 [Trebouxia sp. A1-2]|nr:MAG: hypothetical protein FRX49_02272 [Trebouxia sp. A1-2]
MQKSVSINLSLFLISVISGAASESFSQDIFPFDPHDVRLEPTSLGARAMALNKDYMLSLDVDSLLLTFRRNAGLPAPGDAFAGSWEDPACEVRGQFMGHYLSATARLQDDAEIASRSTFIIAELKKVQDNLGDGYLSAFPTEHFDRLQNLQPVWAPYYVIHKVMAGLLDHQTFAHNQAALQMVIGMAAYFGKRVDDTLQVNGTDHWHDMLNNEFGGMSEVLHNLYGVTKDKAHLRLAGLFVKPSFYEPLVNGYAAQYEATGAKDALTAVEHFFYVITHHHSYATGADQVADAISEQQDALETEETCTQYNMLKLARYLFSWTGNVTYADYYERAIMNGLLGTQRMPAFDHSENKSLDKQHQHTAAGHGTGPETLLQLESSTGNGVSVSRRRLQGTGNLSGGADATLSPFDAYSANWRQAAFAQFRGLRAGQLQEEPENAPGPGVVLYLLPMGAGQSKGQSSHGWGTPLHSFWCCYGSSVESFAKLQDSIYFYRLYQNKQPGGPVADLYINQLVSSSLTWPEQGLTVNQTATFNGPNNTAFTKIAFTAGTGTGMIVVQLRIPSWVAEGASQVRLNGQTWRECHQHQSADSSLGSSVGTALSAGSYCSIKGVFKTGDVITAKLPMIIRAETVQDKRPQFQSLKAVMAGPMLMAGLTDDSRKITANASDLASQVSEASTEGLVSLRLQGSPNTYLQQLGTQIVAGPLQQGNAAAMAATFRMLDISASEARPVTQMSDGQQLVLESMHRPGHVIMQDSQGQLRLQPMQHLQIDDLRSHGLTMQLSLSNAANADEALVSLQMMHVNVAQNQVRITNSTLGDDWVVEGFKGKYPEGSKALHGQDSSYIISPLGNIVDEKYTAYFDFQMPL